MANPSPLTPIGFDTPSLQYAVTPQVAQGLQADMTADTTGLSILGEANKSFQQTNQFQAQANAQQNQALDNIAQAQIRSAQALGQTEQMAFQANLASSQSSLNSFTRVIENVGGVIDKVTKAAEAKRLAEMKAELDRNQIESTTELENLQVDWIEGGRLKKEGTQAYRRAVSDVLSKRTLQADTISTLTTKYYSPALDHAKEQDKLVYETATKTAGFNRDIRSQQLRLDLVTATSGLEQQGPLQDGAEQPYIDAIQEKIRAIYADPKLTNLEKAQIVSESFGPVLASANVWAGSKAKIAKLQVGSAAEANYITENSPKVQSGAMTQSEFDNQVNQIRIAYGLPTKETTSTSKDLDRTVENLATNDKLETLVQKGYISRVAAVPMNEAFTQSIGLQLYLNPASLAAMAEQDSNKLDVNAKAGIKLAQRANKFYGDDTTAYQAKVQGINTAILRAQAGDYKEAVRMVNQANQDNTSNQLASLGASLRSLGLGGSAQPGAPANTGVTQEQLNYMQANSVAVLQALQAELTPLTQGYNKEKAELESLGYYQNKAKSQERLKALEAKTIEYNKQIEAARSAGIKPLMQQPGQSPNFNGGSLGAQVPLTKRSFRGIANVTMPFPVGAANAMADAGGPGSGGYFGDARPGRTHAGTDFPVPTGTPALSLVYGTITDVRTHSGGGLGYGNAVEVTGDDGKVYFYAHLDKNMVAKGQRVGPGEKLGTTGETGAPGQPHLHLEINAKGGGQMDPLQVLSTQEFGQQARQVRTSGPTAGVPQGQISIDPSAIPLGNGKFLLKGNIVDYAPDFSRSQVLSNPDVRAAQAQAMTVDPRHGKIAPGLDVIGFTRTFNPDTSTPVGTPYGYFTLRNKNGGILTQTARTAKGNTDLPSTSGYDGKDHYSKPRPAVTPPPGVKADPSKAGRMLMQDTGQKDEHGLAIMSITLYSKSGDVAGSYLVNSGNTDTQGANRNISGNRAPLPYGIYNVGAPEAAQDIPAMRSDFIPITPTFNTNRSLLGFHFDGDRAQSPGSAGCVVFKTLKEFNAFRDAITASGHNRLEYTRGGGIKVVAPSPSAPSTSQYPKYDAALAAPLPVRGKPVSSIQAPSMDPYGSIHAGAMQKGLNIVGFTATDTMGNGYYTYRDKKGTISTKDIKSIATSPRPESYFNVGFDGKNWKQQGYTQFQASTPSTPSTPSAPSPPSTPSQPIGEVRGNSEAKRLGALLANPNVTAFLDAISNAEGNPGFDQGFGYRKIASLAEHPYNGSELTPQGVSSASGAYQFMGHTWGDMKRALGLVDFSPTSQKIAALKQLDQAGVLSQVAAGNIDNNVLQKIAPIWASVESRAGSNASVYGGNQVSAGGTYEGFRRYWNSRRQGGGGSQVPQATQAPSRPPVDSRIPLGNGKYLLNGKIIGASYNQYTPLQQSYASASKSDYSGEGGEPTYGYAQLEREPDTLAAINAAATKTGLPAQWLADAAALHGTSGIQGPEEVAAVLAKIEGKKIATPTDLVAVLTGRGEDVTQLGIHAGRRYDSQFSRFARTSSPIHMATNPDCRMCGQLQASSQVFIPHRGETA